MMSTHMVIVARRKALRYDVLATKDSPVLVVSLMRFFERIPPLH
jgi:hypothetical protein